MDFDAAWCPACDRQILPKRITQNIPTLSPKKPLSRQGKRIIRTKQRVVIDQGPIPLYCSDECQFADLNIRQRDDAPIDPARDQKLCPVPTVADDSHVAGPSSPSQPPSTLDRLAALLNFPPLPPPMPIYEEDDSPAPRQEFSGGIIMAGRLINSLCPPPAKPFHGRYPPIKEPRKPTPGWNDGSNAWRPAVYSCAQSSRSPFHQRQSSVPQVPIPPSFKALSRKSASSCSISSAPASYHHPASPSAHAAEEMIREFSQSFIRRSDSRVSLSSTTRSNTAQNTATPSSPVSTHSLPIPSPRRERHLVHPRAQGKLLVPNVTLKPHSASSDSSASLSSAWSGPSTTPSSRRSARSPLSATSDSDEDTKPSESLSSRRPRRPVENTRAWSYDNVRTYDIMPMPANKVKRTVIQTIDGEEKQVEVEVVEPLKRLFLFADKPISR